MSGDELRRWRRKRGWTQAELAGRLGVGLRTVNRWERMAELPMGEVLPLALTGLECTGTKDCGKEVENSGRGRKTLLRRSVP